MKAFVCFWIAGLVSQTLGQQFESRSSLNATRQSELHTLAKRQTKTLGCQSHPLRVVEASSEQAYEMIRRSKSRLERLLDYLNRDPVEPLREVPALVASTFRTYSSMMHRDLPTQGSPSEPERALSLKRLSRLIKLYHRIIDTLNAKEDTVFLYCGDAWLTNTDDKGNPSPEEGALWDSRSWIPKEQRTWIAWGERFSKDRKKEMAMFPNLVGSQPLALVLNSYLLDWGGVWSLNASSFHTILYPSELKERPRLRDGSTKEKYKDETLDKIYFTGEAFPDEVLPDEEVPLQKGSIGESSEGEGPKDDASDSTESKENDLQVSDADQHDHPSDKPTPEQGRVQLLLWKLFPPMRKWRVNKMHLSDKMDGVLSILLVSALGRARSIQRGEFYVRPNPYDDQETTEWERVVELAKNAPARASRTERNFRYLTVALARDTWDWSTGRNRKLSAARWN